MASLDDYERVEVEEDVALWGWLEENHEREESVWLVTHKKSSDGPYVERGSILRALIAYGWVDSLPRKLDEERTMLLISPRKKGSNWSRINKDIAENLIEEGLMTDAALAAIEQARSDGSWNRLDDVENLVIPEDLAEALDQKPRARELFERFPPSSRRGILEWILNAKRPDTRARRIAETAEKASKNIKANFPKGRDKGPAL